MFKRFLKNWYVIQARERQHVLAEMKQVRGLVPLLMQYRSGETWTAEDKAKLVRELRALAGLSPYLLPILLPGGVLFLPLLAWWLDRRRTRRENS